MSTPPVLLTRYLQIYIKQNSINNNNDISFSKLHIYIFDRSLRSCFLRCKHTIHAFDFIAVVLSEKGLLINKRKIDFM